MNNSFVAPYKLFRRYFTIKYIKNIFELHIRSQKQKGIDRMNALQFSQQSKEHFRIIKNKCNNCSYKFSPYLEVLRPKGRNKEPRIIAIPTVRDRIVLYILKEILSEVFYDCVPRKLANTYIIDIIKFSENKNIENLEMLKTDITNFYGSIDRDILIKKLQTRIKSKKIITLVKSAIETPIVPKNFRKNEISKYQDKAGIPQGLSISNILAAIYVSEEIDRYIQEKHECMYLRYVDDIFVLSTKNEIVKIEISLKNKLKNLKLDINKSKTELCSCRDEFNYLGYSFKLPKVTVKQASVDKFVNSIAAKFSYYIHNREKKLSEFEYLNTNKLKEIFVLELNEKITGAVSENKRYGWIFYFNAINDLSVLYKIDNITSSFFKRLDDFHNKPPSTLKKLSKAYFEGKYNPKSNYIHNYNQYQTYQDKLSFLVQRGFIDPQKGYSEKKINKYYSKFRSINLSRLEKDDANIY